MKTDPRPYADRRLILIEQIRLLEEQLREKREALRKEYA